MSNLPFYRSEQIFAKVKNISNKTLLYILLSLMVVLLLLSSAGQADASSNNSPERQSIEIAHGVAAKFGDFNPQFISSTEISRADYLKQVQLRNDRVTGDNIFGVGDVIAVKSSGHFTPGKGPANGLHPTYSNLHVEIDQSNNDYDKCRMRRRSNSVIHSPKSFLTFTW